MTLRWLAIVTIAIAPAASAADLRDIWVKHEKGVYTFQSEVWFDASVGQMYEVFRSWDRSTEFSSTIVEAYDIEADEQGRPGYYSRMKGCVLFFCLSFVRQGHVEFEQNKVLKAFADPETSDFEFADESWTFTEEDGGTVVVYDLKMKPKFWVPPAIGPYFIKRKLKKDGGRAIDRMEEIAQALPDE